MHKQYEAFSCFLSKYYVGMYMYRYKHYEPISGYLGGYDVVGLILVFGDDPLQVTAELCGRREEVETDSDHLPALL